MTSTLYSRIRPSWCVTLGALDRHTYAQLAAGFGIGTTTACRYVAEVVDLLADLVPTSADAARPASMKAFVLLNGTLLPIDRIAADRPARSEG